MIDYLIVVALGVGVFYAAYFFNLLSGIAKNLYVQDLEFDWHKLFKGVAKWLIAGIATVGGASVIYAAGWYGKNVGVEWGVAAQALSKDALIAAVTTGVGYQIISLVSNIAHIFKAGHTEDLDIEFNDELADYEAIADKTKEIIANVADFFTPEDYAKKHGEWEEKGGIGQHYTVPIGNFEIFKNATLGRGYDIDNYYGQQCWDYAALLWQQLGLSLLTGNGLAIGCWDLKREVNKSSQFDLVYNVNDLKAGDVVVMRPNHIGFFVGWSGNYMQILGQNQGGTPCAAGGSAVNIVNIAKSSFAGAFRYKAWNKATTTQVITQPVSPTVKVSADDKPKQSSSGSTAKKNTVTYKYKKGDTFGQVILNLGLQSSHGLWGTGGDVEYYTNQLHEQGIYGNIPVGATITLTRRN